MIARILLALFCYCAIPTVLLAVDDKVLSKYSEVSEIVVAQISEVSTQEKAAILDSLVKVYSTNENFAFHAYVLYELGKTQHYSNPKKASGNYIKSYHILVENNLNFANLRRRNLYNISSCYRELKEHEHALQYQKLALSNSTKLIDSVKSYYEIGKIYNYDLGKYQIALDYLSYSETLAKGKKEVANKYLEIIDEKAQAYGNLGNVEESLKYYNLLNEQTNKLQHSISEYDYYKFSTFKNIGLGNLMLDLKSFSEAKQYYEKAIEHAKIINDEERLYQCYANLLKSSAGMKEPLNTSVYLNELLELKQDSSSAIYNFGYKGDFYVANDQLEAASKNYQYAIDLLFSNNNSHSLKTINASIDTRSQVQILLDLVERKLDAYKQLNNNEYAEEGLYYCLIIDSLLNETHYKLYQNTSKIEWRKRLDNTHSIAFKFCNILNDEENASYFLRRNKYSLLKDRQIENYLMLKDASFRTLNEKVRNLQKVRDENLDDFSYTEQYYSYLDTIRSLYSYNFMEHDSQKSQESIITNSVYEYVSSESLIVDFYNSNNFTFILTTNSDSSWIKTIDDSTLNNAILNLQPLLRKPFQTEGDIANYSKLSNKIYKALLPENLKGISDITIIPSGIINYIPFEALSIKENELDYLVNHVKVNYQLMASQIKETNLKNNKNGLAYYAPINYPNDELSPLLQSPSEQQRINRILKTKSFLKEAATTSSFEEMLSKYKIIHASTHASGGNDESDPWIAFSDKKLYASEIYRYQSNADLLVLGACETQVGDLKAGEGVFSLSHSFFHTGIKSVLTSLWKVNESSTEDIMVDFYKHLSKDQSKSEALRNAKLDYLQHASALEQSPYYWAPFIVIGNNDSIQLRKNNRPVIYILSILFAVFIISFLGLKFVKTNR